MRGLVCLAGILSVSAFGQQAGRAHKVELAIPFGVVSGTLVTAGEHLIFIDDQQPGDSFAINRPIITDIRVENGTLQVQMRQSVRHRGQELTRLTMRLLDAASGEPVVAWSRSAPASPRTDERPAVNAAATFDVRHNHTFGGCTGRLIVSADRLVYESVTELNDSRQWTMSDIRELKRDNPYHLEVQPFTGNSYTFEFSGTAMDNKVYSQLVDRIAAARAARP
jgi:hypothetical protein